MQKLKIDLLKLNGAKLFTARDGTECIGLPLAANNVYVGQKGHYLTITLMENRDGPSKYGDDGFAVLETTKEQRDAGEKGAIVGNWKHAGQKSQGQLRTTENAYKTAKQPPTPPKGGYTPDPDDDDQTIPVQVAP